MKNVKLIPSGRHYELAETFIYKDAIIDKGFLTDGISYKFRVFALFVNKYDPRYITAVVVHDYLCDKGEYKKADHYFKELLPNDWRGRLMPKLTRIYLKGTYGKDKYNLGMENNMDIDKERDKVVNEAFKEVEQEKNYSEQIEVLKKIIEDCKKDKGYRSPNLEEKIMIIEILKTLNDQNIERFNYHEKTTKTLGRIEEKQDKIDKKYSKTSIGMIIGATAIVSIVMWENKEMIISILEPVWKIIEPFIKVTKGE